MDAVLDDEGVCEDGEADEVANNQLGDCADPCVTTCAVAFHL